MPSLYMRWFLALSVTLWAASIAAATSPLDADIARRLSALERRMQDLQTIRDRQVAEARSATSDSWHLRLQLQRAVAWRCRFGHQQEGELRLELRHHQGRTLALPAQTPGWRSVGHAVEIEHLEISPVAVRGRIVVHISGDPLGAVVPIDIAASLDDGGTFTITADHLPSAGLVARTGRVELAINEVPMPDLALPPRPREALDESLPAYRYRLAMWADLHAEHLYQQTRAALWATAQGLGLAHAWAMTDVIEVRYPDLPEVTITGQEVSDDHAPSLDDVMLEGALGDMGGGIDLAIDDADKLTASEADRLERPFQHVAEALTAIEQRVERRRAVLEQMAGSVTPVSGSTIEDPHFGPWFTQAVITANRSFTDSLQRLDRLPAGVDQAGPQRWAALIDWQWHGPFAAGARPVAHSTLPPLVPIAMGSWPIPRGLRGSARGFTPAELGEPGPGTVLSGHMMIRSPVWARAENGDQADFNNSAAYATTVLTSAAAQRAWLGITIRDHAALWVNDQLVWTSPPITDPRQTRSSHVFPVDLVAGDNRLLLRCENMEGELGFSLRVALQGRPRDAAAGAATIAALREASQQAGRPGAGALGWRADYTGRYETDSAPLAWDPEAGINLRWRTRLGFSQATPVVVGNRVISMEDPQTVVCLDLATGAVLWRNIADIALTRNEAIRQAAEPLRKAALAARARLEALGPDQEARLQTLVGSGTAQAAAEAQLQELEEAAGAHDRFISQRCGISEPSWYRDTSHTYPTPVSDGRHVWIKSNTGSVACLDLADGSLRWIADHGFHIGRGDGSGCAHVSSPLLVGDTLLVFGARVGQGGAVEEDCDNPGGNRHVNFVRAYDAATGTERWQTETWLRGEFTGTPVPLRLANGQERMDVIATPNGALLRLDDGRVLIPYLGAHEIYGSPISDGANTVFYGPNRRLVAYELIMLDRDTVGARPAWDLRHLSYSQDGNYGIHHDGRLYYSRPALAVSAADDGALLAQIGSPFWLPRNGRGYQPNVLAAGHLYLADNGTWFAPTNRPHTSAFAGALSALLPGEDPIVLARNRIPVTNAGFAVSDGVLLVRARNELFCFAVDDDAGRRFQALTIADEIFTSALFPDLPATGEALTIAADADAAAIRRPQAGAEVGRDILSWLVAGPVPESDAAAVVAALSQADIYDEQADSLRVNGRDIPLRRLHGGNIPDWRRGGMFDLSRFRGSHLQHIGHADLTHPELDVFRVSPAADGMVLVCGTLMRSHVQRLVRTSTGLPDGGGVGLYLGGTAVGHNRLVDFPDGTVPLAMTIPLTAQDGDFFIRPRLLPAQADSSDADRWRDRVRRLEPYLREVLRLAPDSPQARRAQAVLQAL